MQTISFAESGRAGSGVASAAWRKKSQLMKANLSSPRALCDGYVALGFCPRITRINANVGQASCLPEEAASCCLLPNFCRNDGKKEFGFPSPKPLNSGFMRITRKRLTLEFPLWAAAYEDFLSQIAFAIRYRWWRA